jgi:hypothetical protein
MKMIRITGLSILSLFLLVFYSCEKVEEDQKGKVELSFQLDDDQLKSFLHPDTGDDNIYYAWHILLSVVNENGEFVFEDEVIPLISFGDEFITGKIEMETGSYEITSFMVIGPEGNVIYAAPRQGSSRAFLVNDPLPVKFVVRPGDLTRVSPEVLVVGNSQPSDFGYVAFGFNVVNPIVAHVVAVNDNPLAYRPSSMVPAHMMVFTPDGRSFEYKLEAKINRILIKPGYRVYHVVVENPEFHMLEMEVSAEQFRSSSPDNPLIFRLGENPQNLITIQPGPERGKDAMITDLDYNKNFGDYDYFEASFMTEPVLTVMRTKRSLIQFDLEDIIPDWTRIEKVTLVLQFETPIWDSLYQSELDDFMLWDGQLVFRQIVEPWKEYEVTWENQPQTIEANQVFVPMHPEMSSNIRSYDVTSLFVPIQEIAAPNYGFMFMHPYSDNPTPGGMKFASSDHPLKEMRPKLVVEYSYYPD